MSDSTPTSVRRVLTSQPISQNQVVDWLEQAASAARAISGALDIHGFDAADVLLSPLFITSLKELRDPESQRKPNRIRRLALDLKERVHQLKISFAERWSDFRSVPAQTTDVVLMPRDLTHLTNQVPVARSLSEAGVSCQFIVTSPKVFTQLRKLGFRPVSAAGMWPTEMQTARLEGARRVRELAVFSGQPLPFYHQDALTRDLSKNYWQVLLSSLPEACKAIAIADVIARTLKPKLLIVGHDVTLEGRAAALVARQQGIPSAVLMHGILNNNPLYRLRVADRIMVYGDLHKRTLISGGASSDHIVTCGAPYLDQKPRQTGRIHPQLGRLLDIAPQAPWFLVALSGPGHFVSHHHHQRVIEELMRASLRLPGAVFVVKLHRKDHPSYYQEVAQRLGAHRLRIVPQRASGYPQNIFDWLQGCRAVLTGTSTVAIEAMLMEVPVISMDFCNEIRDVEFVDAGATLHATNATELDDCLSAVLEHSPLMNQLNAKVQDFLRDSFLAIDGQSSQRTAEALMALINRHQIGREAVQNQR